MYRVGRRNTRWQEQAIPWQLSDTDQFWQTVRNPNPDIYHFGPAILTLASAVMWIAIAM